MAEPLPWLSERQQRQLRGWLLELASAPGWHGGLPVVLLDRPWLRLRAVPVAELAMVLPPNASADAPELERYRQLIARGQPAWIAQLQCWEEYGQASCQAAQRRLWQSQEQGRLGWTLAHYSALLASYRASLEPGVSRRLPLLVLAEPQGRTSHQLLWLQPQGRSIGHTCA